LEEGTMTATLFRKKPVILIMTAGIALTISSCDLDTSSNASTIHHVHKKPQKKDKKEKPKSTKAAPVSFANCTEMQKVYPHGVAKSASDAAKDGHGAVVNPSEYWANSGSDRDDDGVACEA